MAAGLGDVAVDEAVSALVTDCADGSADACTSLLVRLAEECHQGSGTGCDVLYWVSEVGSPHEAYGATCGGRYGWADAGACRWR